MRHRYTDKEDQVYFHINNGGITFKVDNREDGALLVVSASHFGIKTNQMEIPIDPGALRALSTFFKRASQKPLIAHDDPPIEVNEFMPAKTAPKPAKLSTYDGDDGMYLPDYGGV
jgi:hypothetical protein